MAETQQSSGKKGTLTSEIAEVDSALIRLLGKRTRLLSKAAGSRRLKKKSMVDPQQEKELWRNFRHAAETHDLDGKMMRSLFNVVNALAYERAERKQDWEFLLRPNQGPVRIEVEGPRDDRFSRMWVFLAAASGRPFQLSPVTLNDPLFEIMKACNQAGGSFYWEQDRVLFRGGGQLDFDATTVFSGQDPFNLYLLLFLAARRPCVCRFSGGSRLKLIDLRPVETLLRDVGARMVSLVPGSHGLPLRLESGGQAVENMSIPSETSEDMLEALVLALAATLEPGASMRLQFTDNASPSFQLPRTSAVLEACGAWFEQGSRDLSMRGGPLTIPEHLNPPLDPLLSGFLLGMAYVSRGQTRLYGRYPIEVPEAGAVLRLFKELGLEVRVGSTEIQGTFHEDHRQELGYDTRDVPGLLPLALALAVSRQGETRLRVETGEDLDFALFLLDALESDYSVEEDRLCIHSGLKTGQGRSLSISSLNAWWSMALALIALKRPRLSVQNPGELTQLWPHFWSLYKGLPDPQRARATSRSDPDADARKKIRRKVDPSNSRTG